MKQQPLLPLPQPLDSPQPPSERDIKNNLQKYSPFYKQAMHFDKKEVTKPTGEKVEIKVETLFYVAHDGFSSEKAVEKLKAFDLFEDKKIVFAEFQRSEDRLRDPPAEGFPVVADNRDSSGTIEAIMAVAGQVNGNPSANQNGPGDHFTVKVKMPDSYVSNELIIYGDGKCGIVASIVALTEIASNWVLFYDVDIENEKIVKSDPHNPYDKLLYKEHKNEVIHYKGGEAVRYGDEKLHHHVVEDLNLVRSSDWFSSLEDSLQERVSALLDNTTDTHLLSPKEVHEIISTNVAKLDPAKLEKVANISPQHIHEIPSDETMARGAVAVIPSSVLRGEKNEGIELRKDAKHEFRIIVLNILHEWIEGEECDFSKIDGDDFLKDLIAKKLGGEYAGKIQEAFGADKITFKSLLAIDEVEDQPRPLNRDDQLKVDQLEKEREAFYSAPCGNDKKVFEKILDIAEKFCQYLSFIEDEYSKNEEILLEELKEVLKNFTNLSPDEAGQIKLASINSLINELEEKHLSDFTYELDCKLAIKHNAGGAPAHANAQPDYSYLVQINAGHKSGVTEEDLKKAFPAVYSRDRQALKMYTFPPDLINEGLLERRAPGTQTPTAVASAQIIPHRAADGFIRTRAGDVTAQPHSPDRVTKEKRVTWKDPPETSDPAQPAEGEPKVDWNKSKLQTSKLPQNGDGDKNLSGRKTTANSSQDDFLGQLGDFGVWIYQEGQKNLFFLTTTILEFSETFNIKSFFSDGKGDVDKPNNNVSATKYVDDDLNIFKILGCVGGNEEDGDYRKNKDEKDPKTPDSNILTPIFSVLRSCLGERDK